MNSREKRSLWGKRTRLYERLLKAAEKAARDRFDPTPLEAEKRAVDTRTAAVEVAMRKEQERARKKWQAKFEELYQEKKGIQQRIDELAAQQWAAAAAARAEVSTQFPDLAGEARWSSSYWTPPPSSEEEKREEQDAPSIE